MKRPSLIHFVMAIPLRWPACWYEKRVAYFRFRACVRDPCGGVAMYDRHTSHLHADTFAKTLRRLLAFILRWSVFAAVFFVPAVLAGLVALADKGMTEAAVWWGLVCDWIEGR